MILLALYQILGTSSNIADKVSSRVWIMLSLPLFQVTLSFSFLFPSHFVVMCLLFPTEELFVPSARFAETKSVN